MDLPYLLTNDSDQSRYVNSDYERSRATLLQLLEEGKEAISLAMEIARSSEHPRAIEVLSGLMRNVAEINDKLMDLNKKYKEFYERKSHREAPEGAAVTNNYLFTGTVSDLQKQLADMNRGDIIDITPK